MNKTERALVIGHFSTIGDIESLDYVRGVLDAAGIACDIAPYSQKYVDVIDGATVISRVDPADFTHLIAVCGPFWPELLDKRGISLERFAHCTRIGVNLTMVLPLEEWNPFHVLIERDSTRMTRPDITFLQPTERVPVVGLCTIARQREYGDRQQHGDALRLMQEVIDARGLAAIAIDTRWPKSRNSGALGSPSQVMAVIERVDVLLTNRLHGMVYALKAGVPALAIDPVRGGDKVVAQARVLGWPAITTVEDASSEKIAELLDWCLSPDGRAAATEVAERARTLLRPVGEQLRDALFMPFTDLPLPASRKPPGLAKRLVEALTRKAPG
jgi:hypothetical protein